jgi:hypothetical protein
MTNRLTLRAAATSPNVVANLVEIRSGRQSVAKIRTRLKTTPISQTNRSQLVANPELPLATCLQPLYTLVSNPHHVRFAAHTNPIVAAINRMRSWICFAVGPFMPKPRYDCAPAAAMDPACSATAGSTDRRTAALP